MLLSYGIEDGEIYLELWLQLLRVDWSKDLCLQPLSLFIRLGFNFFLPLGIRKCLQGTVVLGTTLVGGLTFWTDPQEFTTLSSGFNLKVFVMNHFYILLQSKKHPFWKVYRLACKSWLRTTCCVTSRNYLILQTFFICENKIHTPIL